MYKCGSCGFELWDYIGEIGDSYLGLYDDARFPGRCLLAHSRHYNHLTQMPPEVAMDFMSDMQEAGEILLKALGCERINYAILGNAENHVHAHLIPRYGTDPVPKNSPWNHPDEASPMSPDLREFVVNQIKRKWNK